MIGIFDSGFGGLAIFKEISKALPNYQYIYLGDSARTPYGSRSQEVIYQYTEQAVDFLFKQGCELIIIACGTASAKALRKIQQEFLPAKYPDKKVLGIIKPLAEEAVKVSRFGRIGVVGTKSTVNSLAYVEEIKKLAGAGDEKTPQPPLSGGLSELPTSSVLSGWAGVRTSPPDKGRTSPEALSTARGWGVSSGNENIKVFQQACPLLVPLIEEGWAKKPEAKMILKKYLRPLKQERVDTLILGCTHYPLMMKEFEQVMGKSCNVLDSGKIIAESLKDYLNRHPEVEKKIGQGSSSVFYTTDDPINFSKLGSVFFGDKIEAKKVEL